VVELERTTAPRRRAAIERGLTRVVVPFGSIEAHGGHLPLGADALLADAVGREVALRLGAALAPTVRAGCDAESRDTLSVDSGTLTEIAVDMARSLARQGFRLIVFVSAHGGNAEALRAAVARLGPIAVAAEGDVGPRPGSHSGAWLTSVMLALHPDLVELGEAPGGLAAELREADARRGAEDFERFVAGVVGQVPP
jgi:creatinine amidohydrolase